MELETLSFITAAIDIVNVSQSAAKLITRVTNLQDQDFSQICFKILGEKKRTEEWVNQMRGAHGFDLGQHLTQEEADRISSLLHKLGRCYRRLDRTLQDIVPSNQKSKGGRLIAGSEYNDLNNIVDTLSTINKTLREISFSPPRYSAASDDLVTLTTRTATPSSRPSSLVGPLSRTSTLLESSSIGLRSQVPATIMEEDLGVQRPVSMISVHYVWQKTLYALTTISGRRLNKGIARAASRLKLWGAGIFQMAIPLDEVFDAGGSNLPLRRVILRVLVDILVWEEQELNKLVHDELNSQRPQDRQMAKEITALLGTNDLISMALESWKDLVDELEYDPVALAPKGYDLVPDLVELLFCLLPALRAARRGHCSRLARDKAHPSKSNVPIFNSPNTTVWGSIDAQQDTHAAERKEVERVLDIAAELLAKRDKLATKRSKNAERFAPGFEKERDDLREYFQQRRSGMSINLESMKHFEIREKKLREALTEYRQQISRDPNVRGKLANLRPGKSKDKHLQIRHDIGRATEVIDFLNVDSS